MDPNRRYAFLERPTKDISRPTCPRRIAFAGQVGELDRDVFNLLGQVREVVERQDGVLLSRTRYDRDGQRLTAEQPDGTCIVFTYDEHGKRLGPLYYSPQGSHLGSARFSYDRTGQRRDRQIHLTTDASLVSVTRFAYDAQSRRISQTNDDYSYTFRYDTEGNRVDQMSYRVRPHPTRRLWRERTGYTPEGWLRWRIRYGWRCLQLELREYRTIDRAGNWRIARQWCFRLRGGWLPWFSFHRLTHTIAYFEDKPNAVA